MLGMDACSANLMYIHGSTVENLIQSCLTADQNRTHFLHCSVLFFLSEQTLKVDDTLIQWLIDC